MDILWEPSEERKQSSQMAHFRDFLEKKCQRSFREYKDLHHYSVTEAPSFWKNLFLYFRPLYRGSIEPPYKDRSFFEANWFPEVKLNFAQNLLNDDESFSSHAEKTAIHFIHELGGQAKLSFQELKNEMISLAEYLHQHNFDKDDVLACYMPNIPETVVAMLSCSRLGGVFTSTSCDFGESGVVERFEQSRPKVLVAATGYSYNGKVFSQVEKVRSIVSKISSIEKVIWVDFLKVGELTLADNEVFYHDMPLVKEDEASTGYVLKGFNDPQYILYSSGTTGKPKCIVHSCGGVLLQHKKELALHSDVRDGDKLMYFTTCGWMMWNWLVSALSLKCEIILYEGSPACPSPEGFFSLVEEHEMTHFGTSPKFLKALEESLQLSPTAWELPKLRMILSTGAPLLEDQFDFVYQQIKSDLQLSSISGGTDIIGCFALGCPLLPVRRGELQCLGLGMDVVAYNEEGKEVIGEEGELICKQNFISTPIYFLNDPQKEKFKASYFESYPGVWHHGDFIRISEYGSVRFFGRSDATLNPGGVRIGTAEIYSQTEKVSYIADSVCVGVPKNGDVEVVLLVKLKENEQLTDERVQEIKQTIRKNTTPRHVPQKIFSIQDIPYTRSGKKMEMVVGKLLKGKASTIQRP